MGWSENTSLVAATLLALTLPAPASGEPIPPQPLWGQLERAPLVVVGYVESNERLRVLETWKGRAPEVLEVYSDERVICPAPGRFEPGRLVLAFLSRDARWGFFRRADEGPPRWYPYGFAYGLVYADVEGLRQFRTLARKALALQQRGRVTEAERLTWALEAASHAATRCHGLEDLAPERWRAWGAKRGEPALASRLTGAQRAALARSYAEDPSGTEDLTLLLPLVKGVPDERLDAAVAARIERAASDRYESIWLPEVLTLAAERLPERAP
ncbi:MAG: hypothetical protein QM704_05160 [Anaeromyxobacteraceae bacterium]